MPEPTVPDLKVLMLDETERRFLDELIVTYAPGMSEAKKRTAIGIWDRLCEETRP